MIVEGLDGLRVHNAFPADGACNIHFLIVFVTFVVHRVSATEENWGVSARKHVFQAHRAILMQARLLAGMVIKGRLRKAASTVIAMNKVFSPTYSAYSTLFTMEDPFLQEFVVEELADLAVIPGEFRSTAVARLFDLRAWVRLMIKTYRLDVIAFHALHLLGGEPVELVCLLDIRLI
jgi:uncharacterized membrane protein